jgi:hypothetical protein
MAFELQGLYPLPSCENAIDASRLEAENTRVPYTLGERFG